VTTVFSGGLAEKLLLPGDLVYSWNGFPLFADDPVARFQAFVNAAKEGEQVVIRYQRGKEKRSATVKF
jgi:S1-C subfamily serine protease